VAEIVLRRHLDGGSDRRARHDVRRLQGEDELVRRGRADVECRTGRRAQSGGRRRERVARPGLVEAQVPERRHARQRRHGLGPGERPASGVGAQRDGDAAREACDRVPLSVLRGHLDGRRDRRAGRRTRGLDAEDELRGRAGGDVERVAGCTRQPADGGRERVAGAGLVEAQARERGDAVRGGDRSSATGGVATFTGLGLDKTGTGYTLTAAVGGLTGATSNAFNITAGAATQLVFSVQPTSATAGSAITPAVQVTAQDAQGNTVTGFAGSVTVALGANPGSGTLSGTKTVSALAGVATFGDLSLDKAGT